MGVSRPTYIRIYASALQKIAKAFVEGRLIFIEGGKVYFDSDWYRCNTCECLIRRKKNLLRTVRYVEVKILITLIMKIITKINQLTGLMMCVYA
jgi:hypothetical protein